MRSSGSSGIGWLCLMVLIVSGPMRLTLAADRQPNFVVIFADDLGYADIGPFGAKEIETPHLDRMAQEGMKLTDFYVSQAVCSASRAALLTGCYSNRVGVFGAFGPKSKVGIHPQEWTIAEVLKQKQYATAIYGKWHLGDAPQFLPTRNGFDDYFGLPYSNDMWPFHPTGGKSYPDLPLISGDKVVNPKVTADDQALLTRQYTEHAVNFIEQHKDAPFFVYVPHSMPHVPIYASDAFKGKSKAGLYGDVISEIDWSVGTILQTLKRLNLDEHTLVIFTSDNGPWLSYGNHAGSAGPLREGKGTAWEGGQRVPCLARWPGKIPASSVTHEVAATIDVLPTIAEIAGAQLPPNKLDGRSIWPLLQARPNAKSPHESYYFYWGRELHAVRSGQWKLHFPHPYRSLVREGGRDGKPGPYVEKQTELALFDLVSDIGEQTNVADAHPDVVAKLKDYAEIARRELGDSLTKRMGEELRPIGQVD